MAESNHISECPFTQHSLGKIYNNNSTPTPSDASILPSTASDDIQDRTLLTPQTIRLSWNTAFSFRQEHDTQQGLRVPQIGAIHAIHGHVVASDEPSTIVMPTGTGKTDTMVGVLVSLNCSRILVVVPTIALRTQIAATFANLGHLKQFDVLEAQALYPIVGILEHRPKDTTELSAFLQQCNVVVTNMQIAGECDEEAQATLALHCPYLFVDEAHHIPAKSWQTLKDAFAGRRIFQFTATPFRNDGKPIGGKIIFNYPLKKALEAQYFKPIRFKSIIEYNPDKADQALADAAVEQLRMDIANRHNHILMARVSSIARAKEVYAIYERFPEFNPVKIHSDSGSDAEAARIRQIILNKKTRIIVCVDMLGEGFDLPELKIAAFHDVRKSLPITLQLVGRFTRTGHGLGEPTVFANLAQANVNVELQELYSQDADWNKLLIGASEQFIGEEESFQDFMRSFERRPEDLPLEQVRSALSTVIYKTTCREWQPRNFREGLTTYERVGYAISNHDDTLVITVARNELCDWLQGQAVFNQTFELLTLFWDRDQSLLYIHSSHNSGYYQDLAKAVAGNVELLRGDALFRCFDGINRLRLRNVGLRNQLGRLISYTMRAGADVEAGLSEVHKHVTTKSNLFGSGFEAGNETSIGCSYKGRIWSQQNGNLKQFVAWCRHVGKKVTDETIDPDEILRGTLTYIERVDRPKVMPITVDWPSEFYEAEIGCEFIVGNDIRVPYTSCELLLINPSETGNLQFALCLRDTLSMPLELKLFANGRKKEFTFVNIDDNPVSVHYGRKVFALRDFFNHYPPVFWFADGSNLEGNIFASQKKRIDSYPNDKLDVWDWEGIDIRKESQGKTKRQDSIQNKVIQRLQNKDYAIIYNDDNSGEAADVVAIQVRAEQHVMTIDLFHCKFSCESTPGGRIKDLYEVCGQAQKSVQWMNKPSKLIEHLQQREWTDGTSRFERGNVEQLFDIMRAARTSVVLFNVYIVQPGVSAQKISSEQKRLLGVTENYLKETFQVPLHVIVSQ